MTCLFVPFTVEVTVKLLSLGACTELFHDLIVFFPKYKLWTEICEHWMCIEEDERMMIYI